MEPIIKRILPLLPLLLLTGCSDEPVPSSTLSASDIVPIITATEDQSGEVEITAVLYNTLMSMTTLSNGDKFYTSLGTPPDQLMNITSDLFSNSQTMSTRLKVMQERTSSEYFSLDTTAGLTPPVRAYVAFERSGGQWTGQTWVDLPNDFTILTPNASSLLSRAQPITLSWSDVDPTTTMQLQSAVICGGQPFYKNDLPPFGTDTGSVVLNAADYFPAGAPDINCFATLILQRVGPARATAGLGLGPGTIQSIKERSVEFTSTP